VSIFIGNQKITLVREDIILCVAIKYSNQDHIYTNKKKKYVHGGVNSWVRVTLDNHEDWSPKYNDDSTVYLAVI
jgi:hypothetical protein